MPSTPWPTRRPEGSPILLFGTEGQTPLSYLNTVMGLGHSTVTSGDTELLCFSDSC